jgi:class 3 adenylate cyclase/tetratricopeptide (TPR) repeat protein
MDGRSSTALAEVESIRQAVAALEAQRATLGDAVVNTALAPLREKLSALEQQHEPRAQERRLVTVIFVDIVQSTAMSHGLEPEEILELMDGALARLTASVREQGGQVTRYMGDGLMAAFGLETTREKDAVQAVRAGLHMLETIQGYGGQLRARRSIQGFDIRVGISTGVVALGGFSEEEHTFSGLPVNLAARLEQAAPPGGILISDSTFQQVQFAFDVDAQAPIRAKGFDEPIPVYLVRRAKPRTFRTISRSVRGVETPTLGRDGDLSQLQGLYTAATSEKRTHLVTLLGDAGVGKSRLLYEFDRWLAARPEPVTAFKGRAGQQMMDVPFGLLRELLAYRFGILSSDPAPVARRKLETGLAQGFDDEPVMKAHFIGALLGYDFSSSPHLSGVQDDSRQLRERALFYLDQYYTALSKVGPMVLLLEDTHWGDEPSLKAIIRLVQDCPRLPLMVLCVARPPLLERQPSWGDAQSAGDARTARLILGPLSEEASRQLLAEVLPAAELGASGLTQRIVDIAEGNPFYLEELIKVMLDDQVIVRDELRSTWEFDQARFAKVRVPTTVTALLQARFNSLPLAQRMVLQQASVIGRTFWSSTLKTLAGLEQPPRVELDSLVRHELIYRAEQSTFAQSEEYRFKHTLMRDVVYNTVLKRTRQAYHGQAAAWLVEATRGTGRSDEFTAVIAVHYDEAGEWEAAVDWYVRAGKQAKGQGAPAEARRFYDRALELCPTHDLERRWRALVGRDSVLATLGELEAREVDEELLVSLAFELQDDIKLADAYRRQGYNRGLRGRYSEEFGIYEKGLAAARRAEDKQQEAVLLGLQVACLSRMGKMQLAAHTAEEALALAEETRDEETLLRNLTNVALFYTEYGDLARGAKLLERQVSMIHALGNREGESIGLSNLGYNYVQLGLFPQAIEVLERSIDVAASIGHRIHRLYGCLNLGLAHVRNQDPGTAKEILSRCARELETLHDRFGQAAVQAYMGLAEELSGDVRQALECFTAARGTLCEIGAPGYASDALAGQVRCELALGHLKEAKVGATDLWRRLSNEGSEGMEFPILAYETCADVFESGGDMERAHLAIERGCGELRTRAKQIGDREWRKAFLENVAEHQRLVVRCDGEHRESIFLQ